MQFNAKANPYFTTTAKEFNTYHFLEVGKTAFLSDIFLSSSAFKMALGGVAFRIPPSGGGMPAAVGGGIPAEEEDPEETPPPPEGVMADKAIDKGVVGDVTVGVVAKDEQVASLTQLPYQ